MITVTRERERREGDKIREGERERSKRCETIAQKALHATAL